MENGDRFIVAHGPECINHRPSPRSDRYSVDPGDMWTIGIPEEDRVIKL